MHQISDIRAALQLALPGVPVQTQGAWGAPPLLVPLRQRISRHQACSAGSPSPVVSMLAASSGQ